MRNRTRRSSYQIVGLHFRLVIVEKHGQAEHERTQALNYQGLLFGVRRGDLRNKLRNESKCNLNSFRMMTQKALTYGMFWSLARNWSTALGQLANQPEMNINMETTDWNLMLREAVAFEADAGTR